MSILEFKFKNFRRSSDDFCKGSVGHAAVDVYIGNDFVGTYNWNPFVDIEFKDEKILPSGKKIYKNTALRNGRPFVPDWFEPAWAEMCSLEGVDNAKKYFHLWIPTYLTNQRLTAKYTEELTELIWNHIRPVEPNVEDVEECFYRDAKDGSYTYEDFCFGLGYNTDSIRALQTYHKCQKTLNVLMRTGKWEELEKKWEEE